MSMLAVMEYLAENEGIMFNRVQLCESLGMHPGTLGSLITKIRKDWVYKDYFRTVIRVRPDGFKIALHYVEKGTKEKLLRH